MKEIICIGILLVLLGCASTMSEVENAAPIPDGWYNPDKTAVQLSEDRSYCQNLCRTA